MIGCYEPATAGFVRVAPDFNRRGVVGNEPTPHIDFNRRGVVGNEPAPHVDVNRQASEAINPHLTLNQTSRTIANLRIPDKRLNPKKISRLSAPS